jgi:cholesterol oxidase
MSGQIADLIGKGEHSFSSIPLLGMGRETPNGKMTLRRGRDGTEYLEVGWKSRASTKYFKDVNAASGAIAKEAICPSYH